MSPSDRLEATRRARTTTTFEHTNRSDRGLDSTRLDSTRRAVAVAVAVAEGARGRREGAPDEKRRGEDASRAMGPRESRARA